MSFLVAYGGYRNYRRSRELIVIREALTETLYVVNDEIKKNEKLLVKAKNLVGASPDGLNSAAAELESPAFLSTIISALVMKHGTVRLSMQDVLKVGDDYVSVYVDGKSHELILSLNHDLASEDPLSLMAFSSSDDKTFH